MIGAPLTLLYWTYRTQTAAVIITALFGILGVAMRLSLMDLAARVCPEYGEATVFAIFLSVFNLAALTSNTLGAKGYDVLSKSPAGPHGAMAILIVVSAVCVAACWPWLKLISIDSPAVKPA